MGVQTNDDLALAHRLADAAAVVSLSHFRQEFSRWRKSDGSLATAADLAVEDAIRKQLGIERPDDAVLGEERGETGSGGRRWIIDGIDGTIDFAAGSADWGTLIALEVDDIVVVSVCDLPVHGRRYWAKKNGGAFRSLSPPSGRQRLQVSASRDLAAARSYIPSPDFLPDDRARRIAEALAAATTPEPLSDHPALQVATGGYDLAVFLIAGPWDLAAPALIVEEAGGRFTDVVGKTDLTSGTGIFSNGQLHDAVVEVVARACS